jgi:hypothetical protein
VKAAAPVAIAKAIAISTRIFLMVYPLKTKYRELYHTLAKVVTGMIKNYAANSTVALGVMQNMP